MRWMVGMLLVVALAGCTDEPVDDQADDHHELLFDSGDIAPGETYQFTFDEEHAEGYMYHCHPHPWMTAMVHVVADTDGATETVNVDILEEGASDDWGYSVEHLEIEVGDTVVWTNTGALVHTVTQMAGEHGH